MRKIYFIILMTILISSVMADDSQYNSQQNNNTDNATYRVLVDQLYGFNRVYGVNNAAPIEYENRTLNISKGDTIIWINDAVPDTKLTIMSKQQLWDWHDAELRWNYKQFRHTFNRSGIYDIYIKEYSRFQQRIMVGPIEITNITKTINKTDNNIRQNFSEKKKNTSTNNTVPVSEEKKPGNEAIVLIAITSILIYIFDRKIP